MDGFVKDILNRNKKAYKSSSFPCISVDEIHKYRFKYFKPAPFQRGKVWKEQQKGALLKSIYEKTPCGSFVFKKVKKEGKFEIIDGQQRMNCLKMIFDEIDRQKKESDESKGKPKEESNLTEPQECWCINLKKINELKDKFKPEKGGKNVQLFSIKKDIWNLDGTIRNEFLNRREYNNYSKNFIPISLFFMGKIKKWGSLDPQDKEEDILIELNKKSFENIKNMGKYKFPFYLLEEGEDKTESSKGIDTYISLNTSGMRVEKEEIAYAELVYLFEGTIGYETEIYNLVHKDKEGDSGFKSNDLGSLGKTEEKEELNRIKDAQIGLNFIIRAFNLIAIYHSNKEFEKSMLNFDNIKKIKRDMTPEDCEKIWKETSNIIKYLAAKNDEGILRKELRCDDLKFNPDVRSLFPIVFLLAQYPKLMKPTYRDLVAYLILMTYLSEIEEGKISTIIEKIKELGNKKETTLLGDIIKLFEDELKIDEGIIQDKISNEDSFSLTSRWTSLLYWLSRKLGAKDFKYNENSENPQELKSEIAAKQFKKNADKLKQEEINSVSELILSDKVEAQRGHLFSWCRLIKIHKLDENPGRRLNKHWANRIGNLAIISHISNDFKNGGMGEENVNFKKENKDNLKAHFLEGIDSFPNFNELKTFLDGKNETSEEEGKKYRIKFQKFCEQRESLIVKEFIVWLGELKPKMNIQINQFRPESKVLDPQNINNFFEKIENDKNLTTNFKEELKTLILKAESTTWDLILNYPSIQIKEIMPNRNVLRITLLLNSEKNQIIIQSWSKLVEGIGKEGHNIKFEKIPGGYSLDLKELNEEQRKSVLKEIALGLSTEKYA